MDKGTSATPGELAGWWPRVAATLIDNIPVGILGVVVTSDKLVRLLVDVTVSLVYSTVLLGGPLGQTLGMRVAHTRLVRADGGSIGYSRALTRQLLWYALSATIVLGVADIAWPLWDRRNQSLHDKAVGSLLVISERGG